VAFLSTLVYLPDHAEIVCNNQTRDNEDGLFNRFFSHFSGHYQLNFCHPVYSYIYDTVCPSRQIVAFLSTLVYLPGHAEIVCNNQTRDNEDGLYNRFFSHFSGHYQLNFCHPVYSYIYDTVCPSSRQIVAFLSTLVYLPDHAEIVCNNQTRDNEDGLCNLKSSRNRGINFVTNGTVNRNASP